ncbi:hypothetical protein F5Y05DRAFT_423286 [Hypoxylon sp. FL0543]|nr:hypothetical protein F5Y05DRAFT_423286 [Hypoxylon sp. FL0543]
MPSTREYFELVLDPAPMEPFLGTRMPSLSATAPNGTAFPLPLTALNADSTVQYPPTATVNGSTTQSAIKLDEPKASMSTLDHMHLSEEITPPLTPSEDGCSRLDVLARVASVASPIRIDSPNAKGSVGPPSLNGRTPLPTSRPSHAQTRARMHQRRITPPSGSSSVSSGSEHSATSKKTDYEKSRGQHLRSDTIGQPATAPCKHCIKKPERCRVAIDPESFDSFKCAHCISNKVSCDFSFDRPGANYDPAMMSRIHDKEATKKASRSKAKQTNDERRAKANAAGANAGEKQISTEDSKGPEYRSRGWTVANCPC